MLVCPILCILFAEIFNFNLNRNEQFVDLDSEFGNQLFRDYLLSDAARRFIVRRELLRGNRFSKILEMARVRKGKLNKVL